MRFQTLQEATKTISQVCYLDSLLRYALGTRIWQALSALVTLFLILKYTHPSEQGLYYTFNSVLNLQIFFELGLSFVILQCTPHYFQGLNWDKQGALTGPVEQRGLFLSFAKKALRLYTGIAISFLILMWPMGWIFFDLKTPTELTHLVHLPWVLLVLGTTINLGLSPLLALLEGSGKIQAIYHLRWRQLMVANIGAWCLFFLSNALYLAVVNVWVIAISTMMWLYRSHRPFLKALLGKTQQSASFLWRKEIWPMQWRIALSWMAGYFINQIFTPIIFYYYGAIPSGKMGLGLAIMNMLGLFAITWVTVRSPQMGDLVARKEYKTLDQIFFKAFWQSLVIFGLGALGFGLFLYLFQGHAIMNRFLSCQELIILSAAYFFVHIIGALALYLRAHKKELFMPLSILGALLVASFAWVGAVYYGTIGICWSILLVNAGYGLPSAIWLWMKFRRDGRDYEGKTDVSEAYN